MSKETEAGCGAVGAPVEPSVRPQPTNKEDAAEGNVNAIRHIAYSEGYADGVAAERERWRELVGQLVACHEEPTCPAVEWAKDMLAGREGPNAVLTGAAR